MVKKTFKFTNLIEYVAFKHKYIKDNPNVRECNLDITDEGVELSILEGFTE